MEIKLPFHVPLLLLHHLQQMFTGQEIKTILSSTSTMVTVDIKEAQLVPLR